MPLFSAFLQHRDTLSPAGASPFDIIHVRFPKFYRQPVPGISDIHLDLCFIGSGPLVHVLSIHAWIDITGSWKGRSSSTSVWIFLFPVFQITFIRRDFSDRFIDRCTSKETRKLLKLFVKVINRFRMLLRKMT